MRLLSVLGTAAMFLVGGGIVAHGWHTLEALIESITVNLVSVGPFGGALAAAATTTLNGVAGVLIGLVILAVVTLIGRAIRRARG